MTKISALWLLCLLTLYQKHIKLITIRENLIMAETNPTDFLEGFLSQHKCWFHNFEPDTKRQFMQWKYPSSHAPKQPRSFYLQDRWCLCILWCKMYCICWLSSKGPSIPRALCQLAETVTKGYQDQTVRNTHERSLDLSGQYFLLSMAVVLDCAFQLVDYLSYSPDITPHDYNLSPNMEKYLTWKQNHSGADYFFFCPTGWTFLHRWDPSIATTMGEVCGP